jgi:hypothetical protein
MAIKWSLRTSLSKVQCSLIAVFINAPGPLLRETHNQIDHVLINRRRHSSALDGRSLTGADCDTDRCLVVGKVRERLAMGCTEGRHGEIQCQEIKRGGMLKNSIRLQSETGLQLWKT